MACKECERMEQRERRSQAEAIEGRRLISDLTKDRDLWRTVAQRQAAALEGLGQSRP